MVNIMSHFVFVFFLTLSLIFNKFLFFHCSKNTRKIVGDGSGHWLVSVSSVIWELNFFEKIVGLSITE